MKLVKRILLGILMTILGLILIYNIYNIISLKIMKKDLTTVNGYGILEVVSGSMEPTIHVGDLIVVNVKDKDVNVKDIVTFYDKNGSFVTHRIVRIEEDKMITKGDNNDSEDGILSPDKIVGTYVFRIKSGGIMLKALKSPLTMIMIFIIGALSCVYLSMDKDGKVILDKEEQELEEFRKYKESLKEDNGKKEIKKDNKKMDSVKKNTTKNGTKAKNTNTKTNKKSNTNTKKKTTKTTKKTQTKKASVKKVETKKKGTSNKKGTTKK